MQGSLSGLGYPLVAATSMVHDLIEAAHGSGHHAHVDQGNVQGCDWLSIWPSEGGGAMLGEKIH